MTKRTHTDAASNAAGTKPLFDGVCAEPLFAGELEPGARIAAHTALVACLDVRDSMRRRPGIVRARHLTREVGP